MSTPKSRLTQARIIEIVAPIFNQKGYTATSLQDVTLATGLTKGAIYGNFKNKEDLAVQAFRYNVRLILHSLWRQLEPISSPKDKLYAIFLFYRNYPQLSVKMGGCPILNIGIDANHLNPALIKRVRGVIIKLQHAMAQIIRDGIQCGEFRPDIEADVWAGQLFAQIEGAVFMSNIMKSTAYLDQMMDHLEWVLQEKILK